MRILLSSLVLLFVTSTNGQLLVIPSRSVKESQISILHSGKIELGKSRPVSNFCLFLKYDAEKPFFLKLAGHPIELPAGEKMMVDVTFEHIHNAPATIHVQRPGDLKPQRIEMPGSLLGVSPLLL